MGLLTADAKINADGAKTNQSIKSIEDYVSKPSWLRHRLSFELSVIVYKLRGVTESEVMTNTLVGQWGACWKVILLRTG